jgi:drug/metabolite transporter (DMT)-like permease
MYSTALVLSLLVSLLWGVQTMLHKYLIASYSPQTMMVTGSAFYMMCLAAFAVVNWGEIGPDIKRMTWSHVGVFAAASVLCGFVANVMYYFVLQTNTSSIVAALTGLSPLFTMMFAYVLLKEKVTPVAALAVCLITTGILLLSIHS